MTRQRIPRTLEQGSQGTSAPNKELQRFFDSTKSKNAVIAVTGGRGRLGHFIVPELQRQGYTIRHLRAYAPDGLAANDFRPFLAGCAGLVHTAFSHIPGRYRGGGG